MKKTYVLDTNILLDSPTAVYGFQDNDVVITGTTLQELDGKKTMSGELGFNAREAFRVIEALRTSGDIKKGIKLPGKGLFRVVQDIPTALPAGYSIDKADNRIIATVIGLSDTMKSNSHKVVLVTNDISMRINAVVCGIPNENVEFYRNDHISKDDAYLGKINLTVDAPVIDAIYTNKEIDLNKDVIEDFHLIENEFVILSDGSRSALGVFKSGTIKLIDEKKLKPCGITPKNAAQKFALYALLAPVEEIPFVILNGPAGCAKTFLSLAAGLEKTYDDKHSRGYDKVLISRNNVMSDADFGYLPGDLEEKMNPLLAPFYDNLESLLRGKTKEEPVQIQTQIEDMFESGVIGVCPMAYMRGRSISNSYLIVDEAQNATRTQIRDVITRAGEGTKIVIAGDPAQIDAHTLDKWNNGLVFASEKMKGSKLCAQITFETGESVRSKLAKEAIERLIL